MLLTIGIQAFALEFEFHTLGGTMTQPGSSYYHYVYGAKAGITGSSSAHKIFIQYWERPIFSASGFRDQDLGYSTFYEAQLTGNQYRSFNMGFGYAAISGFIEAHTNEQWKTQRRGFYARGPLFQMSYTERIFGNIILTLAHQMTVGIVDQTQFQANVVWPFSFMFFKVGVAL